MDIRRALKGQFHAALDMLKRTIELCPDDMWTRADGAVPFWQVAYHTLYFTHLYLHQTHTDFTPWEHHRPDYHDLPWPADSAAAPASPYTKAQVLDYWRLCDAFVESALDALDLSAAESGFPWHADFPKLEHQLQNLRHIQHHTASLSRRLRDAMGDDGDVAWVRFRHEER